MAGRQKSRTGTIQRVYRFAAPHNTRLSPVAADMRRRGHDLRNSLVALQKALQADLDALDRESPDVAVLTSEMDELNSLLGSLHDQVKRDRQYSQSKAEPAHPGLRARIAAVTEARAVCRRKLAEAKAVQRAETTAQRSALRARYKADIAAARKSAVDGGLYWGTANRVVDDFRAAVNRGVKTRQAGGQTDVVRFHRWTGEGTLTTQVMHQAGDPARTLAALSSGTHPRSAVLSIAGTGRRREVTVQVAEAGRGKRIGPAQQELVPVIWHRPVPADAEISYAQVTRRRKPGGSMREQVALTCDLPCPEPRTAGYDAAVSFGWRSAGSGGDSLWVAGVAVTGGTLPPVPADLLAVVSSDGRRATVTTRPEWRMWLTEANVIESRRDHAVNDLRDFLTAALSNDEELAETLGVTAHQVRAWKSPARFAGVAWRAHGRTRCADSSHRFPGVLPSGHPVRVRLEAWRDTDMVLRGRQEKLRRRAHGQRDDAWRKVAAWVCDGARSADVSDVPVARLTTVPAPELGDSHEARRSRVQADVAAPGRLRQYIREAAEARGVRYGSVG